MLVCDWCCGSSLDWFVYVCWWWLVLGCGSLVVCSGGVLVFWVGCLWCLGWCVWFGLFWWLLCLVRLSLICLGDVFWWIVEVVVYGGVGYWKCCNVWVGWCLICVWVGWFWWCVFGFVWVFWLILWSNLGVGRVWDELVLLVVVLVGWLVVWWM